MPNRRYSSDTRAASAQQTRRRILAAAELELKATGYAGMTMTALARRAEVSPQTVYNAIGGKAAVVKAVYDVLLAGDDEPVPLAQRPEFTAVATQPDPASTLRAYVAFGRLLYERVGELLGIVLLDGPGADPEISAFLATLEQERRVGNESVVQLLRSRFGWTGRLSPKQAVDVLWTMTGFDVADRLVRRCGWTLDAHQEWVSSVLVSSICDDGPATGAVLDER